MATDRDQNLKAVLDFFEWSIPTLVAGPKHTGSSNTRPPAKFDKHFHTKLTLQRVVYCPSLVDDFEAIADDALAGYLAAKTALPSTSNEGGTKHFPDKTVRHDEVATINDKIKTIVNEDSIRNIYATHLIPHCLTIASTLEFQLSTWTSGYLTWDLAAPSDESGGIADGFLQLKDSSSMPSLYKTTRKYFPILAVWEFKNLKAGSRQVFESIRELGRMDYFPWTACDAGQLCGIKCKSPPDLREPLVIWQKLGPDAPTPVCQSTCKNPSDPLPPITSEISAKESQHGKHITQQVWAEMVKEDTTFACLSSGHLKMYFYRHRLTGRLYISNVLQTDKEKTAKILTGFLIAAVRDAMKRTDELERKKPETWDTKNPFIVPLNEKKPTPQAAQDLLLQAKAQQWLILSTQKKLNLKSLMNSSGSFLTETFYRRTSANAEMIDTDSKPDGANCLHVSIIGDRHTSKGTYQVNGVTFPGIPEHFTEYVVVKTANSESALIHRKNEFQVILDLEAANVTCIPDVLGCFWHHPNNSAKLEYAAFIFEDVGDVSLDELWSKNRSIDKSYADAAKKGLKDIHKAGYRHGNISLCDIIIRNCIRSDRSIISFVNFRKAKKVTLTDEKQKRKMKEEEEELGNLLLNPLKRPQEVGEEVANETGSEELEVPTGRWTGNMITATAATTPTILRGNNAKRARSGVSRRVGHGSKY